MAGKETAKFGLGVYWPDDYTDYLVHFHDPFAVFRLETDREGPVLLWGMGNGDLTGFSDLELSRFLGEVESFLTLEGIGNLGTGRHAEYRESRAPFPPCLVVSNRSSTASRPWSAWVSDRLPPRSIPMSRVPCSSIWMSGSTGRPIR